MNLRDGGEKRGVVVGKETQKKETIVSAEWSTKDKLTDAAIR